MCRYQVVIDRVSQGKDLLLMRIVKINPSKHGKLLHLWQNSLRNDTCVVGIILWSKENLTQALI